MKITPDAKDIVQGSTSKRGSSQNRVSVLSSLLSVDMAKPSTDFEKGVQDGKRSAITEFKEGRDFPQNYDEFEKGRKAARKAFGALLGLNPEREITGAVDVPATKPKKAKK